MKKNSSNCSAHRHVALASKKASSFSLVQVELFKIGLMDLASQSLPVIQLRHSLLFLRDLMLCSELQLLGLWHPPETNCYNKDKYYRYDYI